MTHISEYSSSTLIRVSFPNLSTEEELDTEQDGPSEEEEEQDWHLDSDPEAILTHVLARNTCARALSLSMCDPFSQVPQASFTTDIADVEGQSTGTAKRFVAPLTHRS